MSIGSLILIGIIAVMLFGKDLPQVGRKFGKTYSELKRSYQAFRREVNSVVREATDLDNIPTPSHSASRAASGLSEDGDPDIESVAPKFEPPK